MTSYMPEALEMFCFDADMIVRNFLLMHEEEFKAYASTMARELHGRDRTIVSPPDQIVENFANDRYSRMLRNLERSTERRL